MNNKYLLYSMICIFSISQCIAEETNEEPTSSYEEKVSASVNSLQASQNNEWVDWLYGAGAIATAIAGILAVSLDPGQTSHAD